MLYFTFVHGLIILLLFLFPFVRRIRRKAGFLSTAGLALFAVYTVLLVKVAFFPLVWDASFGGTGLPYINLVPLRSILDIVAHTAPATALRQIGGNLLLLAPLGFLAPVTFPKVRTAGRSCLLLLTAAFGIEAVQLLLSLVTGVPGRVVDIDDVLLNLAGGLCGYFAYFLLFCRLLPRFLPKVEEKAASPDGGLL